MSSEVGNYVRHLDTGEESAVMSIGKQIITTKGQYPKEKLSKTGTLFHRGDRVVHQNSSCAYPLRPMKGEIAAIKYGTEFPYAVIFDLAGVAWCSEMRLKLNEQ